MVADSYGQWQGFANQQDQIAASNYFASIQAMQRAQQMRAEQDARQYAAFVNAQQSVNAQRERQAMEAERQREWAAEFDMRRRAGEENLGLTKQYYNWQMTKPDERVEALKDRAISTALGMVQQGYTPDVAAKAAGIGEESYDRTVPVYNYLAKQSQDEARQADDLAKMLNLAKKTVDELDATDTTKLKPEQTLALRAKAQSAQKTINQYGLNPRWSSWVGYDEDSGQYVSRKKALPEFKWKTDQTDNEPSSTPTLASYEPEPGPTMKPEPAPANVPSAFWTGFWNGMGIPLKTYNPPTALSNNAKAAAYANQLMAKGMSREQAKLEARKLYP